MESGTPQSFGQRPGRIEPCPGYAHLEAPGAKEDSVFRLPRRDAATITAEPHVPGGGPPVSDEGSVSRWLDPLRVGDPAAVAELWKRYFPRLIGLARKKLRDAPKRVADEEDVALSAFDSFCRQAED